MQVKAADQAPKRAILYYPTIDVPPDGWLRQALLYWDEISSIVPKDYTDNPLIELSPEVQFLINEGEFNPIHPEELVTNEINHQAFKEFETEFLRVIKNEEYSEFLVKNFYGLSKGNPQIKYWSRIHKNKSTYFIYSTLEEKQLARNSSEQNWYEFETNTALLYMALLAKHLARIQKDSTTVGTDLSIYEALSFKQVNEMDGHPVVSLSLSNLLPVPEQNVSFEKIIDFKRERKTNLIKFRKILLDHQKQISNAESPEHIKDIAADFKEALILGIDDLEKAMKSSKITSKLKSIRSLLNFSKYPMIAAAGAYAESKLNLPTGVLSLPATALSGTIEFGFNFIENQLEHSTDIRDSDFSYVYEAQRAGIIKSI